MSAATFLSPSLPVVLTLITVPAVLWVIAFASKVATKRLAKEEGDPSGVEMSLYWLRTLTSGLATVFAIPLLPYLFFIGACWMSMNDSGTVFRALKALDNNLGLSPEVYACLAYSVMPILLFLFAVFVLKL